MKTEKACYVSVVTLFVVFLTAAIVNDCTGTDEVVSEPYTSSYSYCAQYSYGPKGITTCIRMGSGSERRVNTVHHGMFWTRDSYKIVN